MSVDPTHVRMVQHAMITISGITVPANQVIMVIIVKAQLVVSIAFPYKKKLHILFHHMQIKHIFKARRILPEMCG